jgi:hypothetical protein
MWVAYIHFTSNTFSPGVDTFLPTDRILPERSYVPGPVASQPANKQGEGVLRLEYVHGSLSDSHMESQIPFLPLVTAVLASFRELVLENG